MSLTPTPVAKAFAPNSYGLTKLALLNTAGYAKAVLPLDHSASICAPNNTGKSSVINALQFPLINDLRLTEWDGHDLDETRKFYFSSDQSYILLEADLPHGKVVIGVAGLGKIAGYGHQFFCYNGKLDLNHYSENKTIIKYTKLFSHLTELGLNPIELKATELNALLTGGANPFDSELNLKMIPLNNAADAPVYKEIFRRILNLHKLGASDVKKFMLRVFERHMSNSRVDFYEVWSRAFDKVHRARRELAVLEKMSEAIAALETMLEHQSTLKGKLATYAPKIDLALAQWDDYVDAKLATFSEQLGDLNDEKGRLEDKQKLYVQQLRDIDRKRLQLEQWFQEYEALEQSFALTNLATLQQHVASTKQQYEQLSHSLNSAQAQPLATIQLRKRDAEKQLRSQKLQLKNLEFNLYSRLREDLSLKEVEDITRLLNPDLLSLSTASGGDVIIADEDAFGDFLTQLSSAISHAVLNVPGASINLNHLQPVTLRSAEDKLQIKQQIDALELSVAELEQQEAAALDLNGKKLEKEALYQELMALEKDTQHFERYSFMQQHHQEQRNLLDALTDEEQSVQTWLSDVQQDLATLGDKRSTIHSKQDQLTRQNDRLAQVKGERIDHTVNLYEGKQTPYLIDINLELDTLADVIHHFNKDCQELRHFAINIRNTYQHVYNSGITKFEAESDDDSKYQKLIAAYHNIDNEREAVNRQARVALADVASTIKGLREDLLRLKREMRSFNQGIGQHQISNLKGFEIEVVERKMLVDHIDHILQTSDLYSQNGNMDLLAGSGDETAVNQAKDYLIQYATEKGALTLADLFDIRFKVVNRAGDTEFFDKIDSAGSNGTRITIKLLCGMLFIRHLLAEKEQGKYRIPIYIDEAADIDPQNQRAIIDTALSFGFVPIFASVKPQISCQYLVPIRTLNDGTTNWVDEQDWIVVEQLTDQDAEPQEKLTA